MNGAIVSCTFRTKRNEHPHDRDPLERFPDMNVVSDEADEVSFSIPKADEFYSSNGLLPSEGDLLDIGPVLVECTWVAIDIHSEPVAVIAHFEEV